MKRFFDLPEVNVAIFAFLLNLVWEFAQFAHWNVVGLRIQRRDRHAHEIAQNATRAITRWVSLSPCS